MGSAPELPREISPDGREVWDWADRFSRHVHRQSEMSRLRADIAKIGRECGDCYFWMKSRDCPREHNVNGMSRGPSMGAAVCVKFKEEPRSTQWRAELQQKLSTLQDEEAQP